MRSTGVGVMVLNPAGTADESTVNEPSVPNVADVVEMPTTIDEVVVEAAATVWSEPETSQSPAVKLNEVIFVDTPLVRATPEALLTGNSPTLPTLALSFVVVPTTPAVDEGVIVLVACRVVNLPLLAAVLPIDGGEANNAVNPAPETVLPAESVVNAPLFAAVPPKAGGEAKRDVKPAPETVLVALSVVKAPLLGVVFPMAGGEANLAAACATVS